MYVLIMYQHITPCRSPMSCSCIKCYIKDSASEKVEKLNVWRVASLISPWCFMLPTGRRTIWLTYKVETGHSGPTCTCTAISPVAWCHISTLSVGMLPFLSSFCICWPHSICCGRGAQDASTSKTKSFWTLETFVKLSKRLLSKVTNKQNREAFFTKTLHQCSCPSVDFTGRVSVFTLLFLIMIWHDCPDLVWWHVLAQRRQVAAQPLEFLCQTLMCFKLVRNLKGCKNIWLNDK